MFNRIIIYAIAWLGIFLIQPTSAFAGASDRVSFQFSPKVASQILERVDGETKVLIASNSAFSIQATGMIGSIKVMIEKSGEINGTQFGSAAQLPGQTTTENFLTSPLETSIYQSERKTARDSGNILDQAVLVRITYTSAAHPTFIIQPML